MTFKGDDRCPARKERIVLVSRDWSGEKRPETECIKPPIVLS
jgi:hypothetical protein